MQDVWLQKRTIVFVLAVLGFSVTACGGPLIVSEYKSLTTPGKRSRSGYHAGVDFVDTYGAPVLAAADGVVRFIVGGRRSGGCGNGVMIVHQKFSRYTTYCHLSKVLVDLDQTVKRGERIGLIGASGIGVDIPHVHLELCIYPCPYGHEDGNLIGTENPLAISVGCFDPKKMYPEDRLVLTYPVRCGG